MSQTKAGGARAAATRAKNAREKMLDGREQAFVLHYMGAAKRNGTEAALLAGYAASGDRGQARRRAHEILKRPHVVIAIERETELRNERLSYTADDVLRELLRLKVDAELVSARAPTALRIRLDTLKTIGDHVAVGAFRRQLGLSAPNGGPIETADLAALASLSDEELDQLERARSILDRAAGGVPEVSDVGGDPGGEGTTSQEP